MDDSETVIGAELGSGERLLWAGPARTGIIIRPQDWPQIVFGLAWCAMIGLAIGAMVMDPQPGAPIAMVFFGSFMLVGLYLMGGRLLIDRWRRSRTHYGISSERVLIVQGSTYKTVRSLNLDTLPEVVLVEKPNGSGTITFGPLSPWMAWNSGMDWTGSGWTMVAQFELPNDARRVYEIIREARRALRQGV